MKTCLFAIKVVWQVDKKRVFYEIFYNLIKQFFNVFYGVYFLRLLLNYIETEREMISVFLLLLFMLAVNVLFYFTDNYLKEVYLPCFEMKLNEYIYEETVARGTAVSYDIYTSPDFLDRYQRIMKGTALNIEKILQSFGTLSGLIWALFMILMYVLKVDLFAILLAIVPIGCSFLVTKKGEVLKFHLNQMNTRAERKKDYARRVFYLPDYAKELKMTSVGSEINAIYKEGVNEKIKNYKRIGKEIAGISFVEYFVGDVFVIIIPVVYVAVRMLSGTSLLMGDFVGIAQSITYFAWDVEWFFDVLLEMKGASLAVQEYRDYLALDTSMQEDGKRNALDADSFTLEFQNASYSYPSKEVGDCAIHDLNLTIKKGEKIALVGENGAGKTTFVHLLVGLLSCTKGSLALNGLDIGDYSRESLRHFFGVVPQDFRLYPITIRENICIGGAITDDEIWKTLDVIGLREKISSLDCMFGRELDAKGLNLSGGQQQRLAFARVVAYPYLFVVLDEPASSLDPIFEQEIYQLMFQALKERTLLFISHRMATTKMVDRILVMKNGTIVESGTHEELFARKGHYYHMYMAQIEMFGKEMG